MQSFQLHLPVRIIFGPGTIDELGAVAAELGAKRVMVVSDPGIVAAGHAPHGMDSLKRAGLTPLLHQDVHENPSTADIERGVAVAQAFQPDLIVGLGGGSSMDCAKGINFIYTNGGRMQDYWGVGKAKLPLLPMIAVPTTAGTGSESQSFALISDSESHVKMACGDKKAAFRVAILDPQLTLSQPRDVTALTGIDALSHALETYVSTKRNPVSQMFSREAWRLLSGSFQRVLQEPSDLEARSNMQLGACYAGMAIEHSMLGAAHALANPLTARYGTIHGSAVALVLQHVIRYNGEQFDPWYRELLGASENGHLPPADSGAAGLADFMGQLIEQADLPTRLTAIGVEENVLPELARHAAEQWTGNFNPRQVGQAELLELYRRAM
ncbi:MAG: iron-containing alcohol dehydrogenase [Pirellulales bacterium]